MTSHILIPCQFDSGLKYNYITKAQFTCILIICQTHMNRMGGIKAHKVKSAPFNIDGKIGIRIGIEISHLNVELESDVSVRIRSEKVKL